MIVGRGLAPAENKRENGGGTKLGTPKARKLTSGNPTRHRPTDKTPIAIVGGDLPDAPPL